VGVAKIIPGDNTIVLKNGRSIKYGNLVVALGLEYDYESIKGFKEAV